MEMLVVHNQNNYSQSISLTLFWYPFFDTKINKLILQAFLYKEGV